jgi:hypothetical protein
MEYGLVAGNRSTGGDAPLGHSVAPLALQAHGVLAGANSPISVAHGSIA